MDLEVRYKNQKYLHFAPCYKVFRKRWNVKSFRLLLHKCLWIDFLIQGYVENSERLHMWVNQETHKMREIRTDMSSYTVYPLSSYHCSYINE